MFALLVGSGLSRAAEIPTGWEITLDLIRRVAIASGTEEQEDWAQWYREEYEKEPNYSELLEELGLTPDERRSIMQSYIEPTDEDLDEEKKQPTAAHLAIADLVRSGHIRVIVTTNFDRLLENALRDRGIEPTVIGSVDALAGAEPLTHSKCYILKLHGDYKDARIRNTDSELSEYPAEYNALLDRILDEFGLIVAGWSGDWDHALRAAIIRAPNRRYPMYWATRGSVSDGARQLVELRDGKVIEIKDADEYFVELGERVKTLAESHRRNPLSIDLLIGSAKRFLAKPEHRIQLDQLCNDETTRLISLLNEQDFPANGTWSQDEFRSRVTRYEAASEPLAKLAFLMGRWGDGNELSLVSDLIKSLYHHGEAQRSGLTAWINIMTYPALLVFWSYAIALVKSERFADLEALFSEQIQTEYREPKRFVEALFLWGWRGDDGDLWKNLEGFDRRYTPLSDHVCSILSEWAGATLGFVSDFEMLFERFEMLAAMKHVESSTNDEIAQAHANTNRGFRAVRAPTGRIGWDSDRRLRLERELDAGSALRKKLLSTGYARDDEFIDLFVTNQQLMSSRSGF